MCDEKELAQEMHIHICVCVCVFIMLTRFIIGTRPNKLK